jgi:hypothetical protein
MTPREIQQQIGSGERVLWSGAPRGGIVMRAADALYIPFSLMWGGFAMFWEYSVLQTNAPLVMRLWGIPFVLVGLYLIAGRFFYDAQLRKRTLYAVTDERVLIVSGLFSRQVQSLGLRTLADVSLSEDGDGEGTIRFGAGGGSLLMGGTAGWPGRGGEQPPQFEMIPGARSVYERIREAQRQCR